MAKKSAKGGTGPKTSSFAKRGSSQNPGGGGSRGGGSSGGGSSGGGSSGVKSTPKSSVVKKISAPPSVKPLQYNVSSGGQKFVAAQQQKTSTVKLGPATIAAQQRLSEKYGIPTFTTQGLISTVPTSGILSKINVGVGAYSGSTQSQFNQELQNIISTVKNIGGTVGSTFFEAPAQTKPLQVGYSPLPIAPAPSGITGVGIADQVGLTLDTIKTSIGPSGLLIGVGLLALALITRGARA